ncbi:MAG: OadG family protein [Massilibacteroides sp.]|nr:OadG family protein [Massilibacteroides sp.]MDD3062220.1 OadG family protein [Massilibacteroides sp.]MDD4116250.1 OadG family protein [Massilibacteroides sp.]MDD4659737.1 OadG family protein [Massilibacteroides sp.]
MDSIQTALLLMGVGLPTVFCILFLVIIIAKMLILVVNKYAPEQERKHLSVETGQVISPVKMSAIAAAISVVTQGRGHIEKVEKE